ncbi:MAG: DUF4129 domain-containing protein [Bacteroidia bacterium]|nr:DUF4129 domain-containing protein [Bacteroidia bacterium]
MSWRTTIRRTGSWIGICCLLAGPALRAQQPALDRDRVEAWRQHAAYQYGSEPQPKPRSRPEGVDAEQLLMQPLPLWAEVVIYGLMGTVLALMVAVLIRRGWGRAARQLPGTPEPAAGSLDAEAVPVADYEQLTRLALSQGEYRLAIRYTYLAVLQRLDHLRMIEWQPQKTNADYLRELAPAPFAGQFGLLTQIFESCWYGQLQPGPDHFSRVSELARAFHRELPDRP